jgi:hypothetical protein
VITKKIKTSTALTRIADYLLAAQMCPNDFTNQLLSVPNASLTWKNPFIYRTNPLIKISISFPEGLLLLFVDPEGSKLSASRLTLQLCFNSEVIDRQVSRVRPHNLQFQPPIVRL